MSGLLERIRAWGADHPYRFLIALFAGCIFGGICLGALAVVAIEAIL